MCGLCFLIRWSLIARRLPGRTANDVKNYWNCHLRKRISAEENAEELDQNAMNVEIIRPQPRRAAATPCAMKLPRTPHDCNINAEISQLQPITEERSSISSSTPFHNVEVDDKGGQQETVKEEQDSSQGIFVGDLGTEFGQFDEANVLSSTTDEGCSSKWDWDDLLLDMDLWTNSL